MNSNEKHLNDLLDQALKENEEMRNLLEQVYHSLDDNSEYYVYATGILSKTKKLIKDNIAISVAVEFLIGFWTFDLWMEILLVPLLVFISALYAVAERERKHKPAKSFLQGVLTLLGMLSFVYAIYNLVRFPQDFFSIDTLKVFVLPLILLVLNLPVVYGLAIYNVYEQIFIQFSQQYYSH